MDTLFITAPDRRVRIEHVTRAFEIHGATLRELGERAAAVAIEFYGETPFRILDLDVRDASHPRIRDGSPLVAIAYTESVG